MKKSISLYFALIVVFISTILIIGASGCANIIPPSGGPRDSLPPVLIAANPKDSVTNFTGNRITLYFNEFVEIQNTQENVLVSPTPINTPIFDYKLRTVSVKLKDTLESATTYSINFGDAIKDVNEGNVLKNFTYVFSTGSTIDQNTFAGKVIVAETGKADSTLIVVLHRNLADSAVSKEKPRYITKLDGKGNFQFNNLPKGTFALYALPNDYSKRYDDTTKLFAFADKPITIADSTQPITLYAFSLPKETTAAPAGNTTRGSARDKQLRYTTNLESGKQDILKTLQLDLNRKVSFDSTKIILADTSLKPITNYQIIADTNRTQFTIRYNWPANTAFNLVIDKSAFTDSAGATLAKNDTLRFTTKREDEYGSVKVRFKNLDLTKNPVLQLVQTDKVVESILLTATEWSRKLFPPGEYSLRILNDSNKNGKWDTGRFFGEHRQPEIVTSINTTLSIRANWDNEPDITL
jgi:uncharacterized protein (DUF2141 family)